MMGGREAEGRKEGGRNRRLEGVGRGGRREGMERGRGEIMEVRMEEKRERDIVPP